MDAVHGQQFTTKNFKRCSDCVRSARLRQIQQTRALCARLAVCPVKFVLYLKMRCAIDVGCAEEARQKSAEYLNHMEDCFGLLFKKVLTRKIFINSLNINYNSAERRC